MTLRLLSLGTLCLAATSALSQEGAPPPAGAPASPPQQHRSSRQFDRTQSHGDAGPDMRREGADGPRRAHLGELLPPGTWWRNPEVIKDLALTDEQRKRIEDAFLQSRVQLIDLHAALEKQQLALEPLLSQQPFDQTRTLAAISRIADSRAELEKADARMLLSIRAVLTQDQWQKLRTPHPHGGGPRPGSDTAPGRTGAPAPRPNQP